MFAQLLLVFFGASGTKFQSSVNRKLAIMKKKITRQLTKVEWNYTEIYEKPRFLHQEYAQTVN